MYLCYSHYSTCTFSSAFTPQLPCSLSSVSVPQRYFTPSVCHLQFNSHLTCQNNPFICDLPLCHHLFLLLKEQMQNHQIKLKHLSSFTIIISRIFMLLFSTGASPETPAPPQKAIKVVAIFLQNFLFKHLCADCCGDSSKTLKLQSLFSDTAFQGCL